MLWAGNFQKAWKEIRTLEKENDKDRVTSLNLNLEGNQRAWRMHLDYPVWGVGTGGYSLFALRYASPGHKERYTLADSESMNHYLQVMAEE